MNLAIYCLYLNMENLGLSIFMTQLMFGAIEIPAYLLCMWLLEIFGRRVLFISTLISGGLSCIFILTVPQGKPFGLLGKMIICFCPVCQVSFSFVFPGYAIAVTSLAVAARFFLVWAGSICSVFMQELFPTSIR